MAAVYLYMSNDEIPALEENHIPSRSISFVIAIWGIFRLYKAYTVYSKNRNDENQSFCNSKLLFIRLSEF